MHLPAVDRCGVVQVAWAIARSNSNPGPAEPIRLDPDLRAARNFTGATPAGRPGCSLPRSSEMKTDRPFPAAIALGGETRAVLRSLGYSEERIYTLRIS